MRSFSKLTLAGIALVVLGPLAGLLGTIWSVYDSFSAMMTNESAGIGAVGAQLLFAILFTAGGLVATLVGVIMLVIGIRANRR